MYKWARPLIAIPVHGERRHLLEHAKLARTLGPKHAVAPRNGEMFSLSESGIEVIDIVPSGRLHQDGNAIVSDRDEGLRLRKKMAYAGHVSVSLVFNSKGHIISGPEPRISGFAEGYDGSFLEDLIDGVADEADEVYAAMSKRSRIDEDLVEERLMSKIKRYVKEQTGKRSHIEIIAHKVK